ncbi:MAG: hypothetical protein GY847_29205 [Proteobacteria bacterium]|nr:hypothetical protein [Pseudomonadota bacterium]
MRIWSKKHKEDHLGRWILCIAMASTLSVFQGPHAERLQTLYEKKAAIDSLKRTDLFNLNDELLDDEPDLIYPELDPNLNVAGGLPFFFVQLWDSISQILEISPRVESFLTQWAEPWNRREICHRMNAILTECGVESEQVRVRMTAHAIVASGWRQNIWNYNAWGVQLGSWTGPWYIRGTIEADDDGNYYSVHDAAWRSFSDWREAVRDYRNRISPASLRESYREAYRHLIDPSNRADAAYWESLRKGRYYTDQQFTKARFTILCNIVRRELAAENIL